MYSVVLCVWYDVSNVGKLGMVFVFRYVVLSVVWFML